MARPVVTLATCIQTDMRHRKARAVWFAGQQPKETIQSRSRTCDGAFESECQRRH